jgi:hypothetical protein
MFRSLENRLHTINHAHMKRISTLTLAIFLSVLFGAQIALAAQTPEPDVDTPNSPVDAPKALLTGTTEAGAKIQVVGGPYQISPVYADDDGNFSVEVALTQESTNQYHIYATGDDMDQSEAVTVTILESEEEAAQHEEDTGEDRTAPDAATLDEASVTTEEATYTITGRGEVGASILINAEDSGEDVDSAGIFEVEVDLAGDGSQEKFTVSLMDDGENVSTGVKIYITSTANVEEENAEENEDEEVQDLSDILTEDEENNEDENDDDDGSLTDIDDHWAETYILGLNAEGIISGYEEDNTFRPDNSITRAELMKIASLKFDLELLELTEESESPFTDVTPVTDWFASYVLTGYEQNIVDGYDDNTFRPNEAITRAAALKIILEAADIDDLDDTETDFDDVSESDWYAKYLAFASSNNIISGYEDGLFHGDYEITRAQVCKIVALVAEYIASN